MNGHYDHDNKRILLADFQRNLWAITVGLMEKLLIIYKDMLWLQYKSKDTSHKIIKYKDRFFGISALYLTKKTTQWIYAGYYKVAATTLDLFSQNHMQNSFLYGYPTINRVSGEFCFQNGSFRRHFTKLSSMRTNFRAINFLAKAFL